MKKPNQPRAPTAAQINANRDNAKKSTRPRTAEGKAASSRGTLWVRLLHGLRANKHILLDEDDPEDFLILLKDLDPLPPVGEGEEMLVTRIAADGASNVPSPRKPPSIWSASMGRRDGLFG
jgi:hypothetical protein